MRAALIRAWRHVDGGKQDAADTVTPTATSEPRERGANVETLFVCARGGTWSMTQEQTKIGLRFAWAVDGHFRTRASSFEIKHREHDSLFNIKQ